MKLLNKLCSLIPLLLMTPYVLTNRFHFFPAHEITRSVLDNAIPFTPELTWLYFLLFPFMWWAGRCCINKTMAEIRSVSLSSRHFN